jgi:uncharacterized protein (UPF0264 family)
MPAVGLMSPSDTVQSSLLVSVRSEAEAEAALAGGAALIDVKEPARGSLGQAPEQTIAAVLRCTAGRRPVSAALGELAANPQASVLSSLSGLTYAKWGLAGCRDRTRAWQDELTRAAAVLARCLPGCRFVAVAYADWERAKAPPPTEVAGFAQRQNAGALLLDTWGKDGTTLLDWLALGEVDKLCQCCREAGVPVALAGSLGVPQIRRLLPLRPGWFAVRGAVCEGDRRTGRLCQHRVSALVKLISSPLRAATHGS